MVVARRNLHRRMHRRSRSSAYKNRNRQTSLIHQTRHVAHLFKRWGYQSAKSYIVGMLAHGSVDNFLCRHHHAHIYHLISVAAHHHPDNVFPDVVHVAFHRGDDNLASRFAARLQLFALDEWLKPCHSLLHGARTLHHLRQKHLAVAKKRAHAVHAFHQWLFDDGYRRTMLRHRTLKYRLYAFHASFHKHTAQRFIGRKAGIVFLHHLDGSDLLVFQVFRHLEQTLGRIGTATKQRILYGLPHIGWNLVIRNHRGGVYNRHIHTFGYGMVKKHRVHGLAQIVVAPEGERQIADSSTHFCSWQMPLYPTYGFYKVERIAVVAVDACRHSQHVRVKDYVFSRETHFLRKQFIRTRANLRAAGKRVGLTVFVKSHHHRCRTHLFYKLCMGKKNLLSFFQTDGIDDALSLQTFKSCLDDIPFRRVNHHGHSRHIGLRREQTQKMHHLRL